MKIEINLKREENESLNNYIFKNCYKISFINMCKYRINCEKNLLKILNKLLNNNEYKDEDEKKYLIDKIKESKNYIKKDSEFLNNYINKVNNNENKNEE